MGQRICEHGLICNAHEFPLNKADGYSIKTEHEFIKVALQMLFVKAGLKTSKNKSFDQRRIWSLFEKV